MPRPTPKQMLCKKPAARMRILMKNSPLNKPSAKSAPKRQPKAKAKASTSPSASNGSSDYGSSPSSEIIECRPQCACTCGCRRRPGKGCRRLCPGCDCLVGPGCCWVSEENLCHVCHEQPDPEPSPEPLTAKAITSPSALNGSSGSRSSPSSSFDIITRAWTISRLLHEHRHRHRLLHAQPAEYFRISVRAKDCYPGYKGLVPIIHLITPPDCRSDYMYDVVGSTEHHVRELKIQLCLMEGWPVCCQRLILYKDSFNDRVELDDDMTLGHYGIRKTFVLSLHLTQADAIWSHRCGAHWSHPKHREGALLYQRCIGNHCCGASEESWTHPCGRNPVPTELIPDPARKQLVTQSQLDNEPALFFCRLDNEPA